MGDTREQWFERLRKMAESALENRTAETDRVENNDIAKLIGEIQVYQAELEIQNEELRQSRNAMERSRDRFALLFHQAPVGYLILDENAMVVDANQTIAGMLGRDRSDLVGKPFVQLIVADDRSIFLGSFRAFYKKPERKAMELRLADGTGRPFFARLEGRFIASEIHAENQPADQFYLTVADISASKVAGAKLKKSEAEYRNLVGTLNDAVVCGDLDGRITFFNSRAEALFGYPAQKAVGSPISRFCPDHRKAEQREMIRQVLAHGSIHPYETERLRADGHLVPVEVTLSLRTDEDGRPAGFNGVFRDITERKHAEEALRENELYLRTILRTTVDGFWVVDRQGRIVEVNDAYCTMSGYGREEILGLHVRDVDAEEEPDETAARMGRIIARGSEIFETRHRRKDGSIFPLEMSITWLEAKGGRFVCFGRDLTERKRAETALRKERQRLAYIIEGTNVGTWEWDVQTGATVFNERWAEIIGYSLEEISPVSIETWIRFVHPDDLKTSEKRLAQHFAGKLAYYECEARMQHKDGHWVWVLDRGKVSSWTHDGKPLLMQGTHQDISERKQAEARILQLQKAESLGRMAGAIAHHYNNLLAVVIGNLELAMEDLAGGLKPAGELSQAMLAARKAADLSAQMLAYLGQTMFTVAPLDLSAACRCVLPGLRAALPSGVELETELPEPGPMVEANADQIQQVLGSLLHNAGEAFETKAGAVAVSIRTVPAAHVAAGHRWPAEFQPEAYAYACLEVADWGCGISADILPKIFDPFYTTKFIGRGLGLSVVLGIVKTWGGCIAVESTPDRGSVFRVFLPVVDTEALPGGM